ncbi:MAG: hypothetical protein WD824_12125 [Cyclobacteriaceae bacterium]
MKKVIFLVLFCMIISGVRAQTMPHRIEPITVAKFKIASAFGRLRAVPVQLKTQKAILLVYSEDEEVDPFEDMFFFPKHTLKLVLITEQGKEIWRQELNKGVIPGIWFCPVFPFDLNNDGSEEIWFVNNADPVHPLSIKSYRLTRLDGETGEQTGEWPWPRPVTSQSTSHRYRNFIWGAYVGKTPVLLTAQGTYGPMKIQAWNDDMNMRWEYSVPAEPKQPRGSHMNPVVDIDQDGTDEIMWGERCLNVDNGKEVFVADRDVYSGHSDIIQPVFNYEEKKWYVYTCRESGEAPRVVLFNNNGQRVWSDIEQGHMDMGWTAKTGKQGQRLAYALRIGGKKAGPEGFSRTGVEQFTYDVFTGKKQPVPFSLYKSFPVDLNGDGVHELVREASENVEGAILNFQGEELMKLGINEHVAMVSKFLEYPGEQILTYSSDGNVTLWRDKNAKDSKEALARYQHPFYRKNQKLTATGYNLLNLGGL